MMFGCFMSLVFFVLGFYEMFVHGEPMIVFGCFISSGIFYIGMQIWQIVYNIEKREKAFKDASDRLLKQYEES